MNAIENMHVVRFPNVYILSDIIYFIHPLTTIIDLAIKTLVFLQCIMVISKIKNEFFLIWIFFYFRLKNLLLHVWRDEKKNTKTLNLFHVLNMLKNTPPLKKFHDCFLTHIKTARFVAFLIVPGKWGVSAGLQIYPKKILRRTNKVCKALEKSAQGA